MINLQSLLMVFIEKWSLSAAVFFILLASILYGKDKVHREFNRWYNIVKEQFGGSIKKMLGHLFVVLAGVCVALLLAYRLRSYDQILSTTYATQEYRDKIQITSTTLFMTLITVILALTALAVTTYIFLNDALVNRESYERECIKNLKWRERRRLFINCVLSGACLIGCLILDNCKFNSDNVIKYFKIGAIIATFYDTILLVCFINSIVNYEKHLLELAKSYITFNQKVLISETENTHGIQKPNQDKNSVGMHKIGVYRNTSTESTENNARFVKMVGDLENLVNSILINHESDYHFQHGITRTGMLKAILEKKRTDTRQMVAGSLPANQSYSTVAETIKTLIEIRNCLWILEGAGEFIPIMDALECEVVTSILEMLKPFAFQKERFVNQNFSDVDFSAIDFTFTSLKESALIRVSFHGATLKNTDFSDGLLQDLNLHDADCTGAVFSRARIVSPRINQKTKFDEAVLKDCELTFCTIGAWNSDRNSPQPMYSFKKVLCQRANLVQSTLTNIDFKNAVFTQSSFSNASLSRCCLKWADMSKVIMADATIDAYCSFEYADCTNLVAANSTWGNLDTTTLILNGARFVRSNFKHAKLTCCSFLGAYLNDASFSSATLLKCDFTKAILTNVDFSDAKINQCLFYDALLRDTLFRGECDCETIRDGDFSSADMTNCNIE